MKLLYFAWLKTKIGTAEEELNPPAEVNTVAALLDWLAALDDGHADALGDRTALGVAVNQEYAQDQDPVGPNDEVALFPPVTGG